MKSVFITGAAGFIGSYAVREFVNKGWFVFALVHSRETKELADLEKLEKLAIIRGNITDCGNISKSLEEEVGRRGQRLDVVLHCAGRASDTGWRREFRKTNYEAVIGMARLATHFNTGRFVFISTTDVYGMKDFNGEPEESLSLENNTGNYYPEYKIRSEKWISQNLSRDKYTIIRPAQVWGIGDRTLTPRIVDFLKTSPFILHFGRWKGKNRWPLAHVKNVASAVYLAATLPEMSGQAFNILDDECTSMDDFYRMVSDIYLGGKKHRTVFLPMWTGLMIASCVSLISDVLNLKRPFMDPSLYALYSVSENLDFNNKKIRDVFDRTGTKFVTLEEGMAELKRNVLFA